MVDCNIDDGAVIWQWFSTLRSDTVEGFTLLYLKKLNYTKISEETYMKQSEQSTKPTPAPQQSHGNSHSALAAATEHVVLHAAGAVIGGAIAGPPGAFVGGLVVGLSYTGTLEAPGIPYQPTMHSATTSFSSGVKK